jgi:hypothetical protein
VTGLATTWVLAGIQKEEWWLLGKNNALRSWVAVMERLNLSKGNGDHPETNGTVLESAVSRK